MTFYVKLPPEESMSLDYYDGPYRILDDAIRMAMYVRKVRPKSIVSIYNRERSGIETTVVENMPLLPEQA
jgi:hypothetical protein